MNALQQRLESLSGPGIAATRADTSGSVRYTLFTGAANALVEVTITSATGYRLCFTAQTDAAGMYRGTFGTTRRPACIR